MIIVKTPLRISFMGGGSDIPRFYFGSEGATLSTTIDKYVYICVNKKFDNRIRVSYSQTEIVDNVEQLQHTRAKACMKYTGADNGIEIVSIADIPARGTGLGSSSSYTVGLLKALYAYQGKIASEEQLAREACEIEIDILGEPIGKQDQYIASYGGMRHIRYQANGEVLVDYVLISPEGLKKIEDSLLLFYSGSTRSSRDLLADQVKNYDDESKYNNTRKMAEMAGLLKAELEKSNIDALGAMLDEAWQLKKSLNHGISNPVIDDMYEKAKQNGALGGKILGAGGGGFLMLYANPNDHDKIKKALQDYREMEVKLSSEGGKVLFMEQNA